MSKSKNPYFWQEDSELKLSQVYSLGGLTAAQQAFPNTSRGTLATKASRMGLTNPRPRKKNMFESNERSDD